LPFSANTLLIVGAGASNEIGFPMGSDLKDRIRACTNIEWNGIELTGDKEFCALAEDYARTRGGQVSPILEACKHIHSNVLLSGSIDEFLSSHQEDETIVACAKIAIALEISRAERGSHLNENSLARDNTDFAYLKDTYLPRLWARLQNGESISNWTSFFDGLKIVTFNYDRVLEQFFSLALQRFCRVGAPEAAEFVSSLPMLHVYGSLGNLHSRAGEFCGFAPDMAAGIAEQPVGGARIIDHGTSREVFVGALHIGGWRDKVSALVQRCI